MNNDVELWLDILDKTKNLIRTAHPIPSECLDTEKERMICELDTLERMLSSDAHFSVAFSGLTNVGKSTLMNALLGDAVAPTKNATWSSTAVEYRYSEDGYEMIVPLEGFKSIHKWFQTSEELLAELNQFAVQGSDFQTDQSLVVSIPNELLKDGLIIVDTPGFAATDGTSNKALHDNILFSYLKKREDCLRVFWVIKDNLDQKSLELFKDHLSKFCTDLVVNLSDDEFNENDKKTFEKKYKKSVGHSIRFHYLNALSAVNAAAEKDGAMLEASGINRFKDYLSSFSSQEKRTGMVAEDLCNFFHEIRDYLYLTNHFSCTWLPTAWGTLKSLLKKTNNEELLATFSKLE